MKYLLVLACLYSVGCSAAQEALPQIATALEVSKDAYIEVIVAKEQFESIYTIVCMPLIVEEVRKPCDQVRKALDKADFAAEEVRTALNTAIDVYAKLNEAASE